MIDLTVDENNNRHEQKTGTDVEREDPKIKNASTQCNDIHRAIRKKKLTTSSVGVQCEILQDNKYQGKCKRRRTVSEWNKQDIATNNNKQENLTNKSQNTPIQYKIKYWQDNV